MLHLGDITKISGYTAPVVDCIIGGSPCQDLSVAGKRAGLDGERSGLYMEQIRIVKEMRKQDERNGRSDDDIRPRYMVWENVPGAFSSNKGEDFRIVLEELAKVKDPNAVIPRPADGKWRTSGCIMADGWSIAWRVFDAQFWGVPQRRRRIALVADFGGQSGPEILFVRKSVSRDIEPSQSKRKETPSDASRSLGADDREGEGFDGYNGDLTGDKSATLGVNCELSTGRNGVIERERGRQLYDVGVINAIGGNAENYSVAKNLPTLTCGSAPGFNNAVTVPYTLNAFDVGDVRTTEAVVCGFDAYNQSITGDKAKTLNSVSTDTDHIPSVVYALDRASFNQGKNAQFDFEVSDKGVNSPLVAKGPSAVCYKKTYQQTTGPLMANSHPGAYSGQDAYQDMFVVGETTVAQAVDCRNGTEDSVNGALQSNSAHSLNGNNVVRTNVVRTRYIVRRLTPLECERLQGYPDGWTDIGEYIDSNGKKRQTSDAARYKALGNSISIPNWRWVLKRICACYERAATMASLFDGIGGFPYLWEQLNGKGSCLWASEIEEFPIAVTKVRIGE